MKMQVPGLRLKWEWWLVALLMSVIVTAFTLDRTLARFDNLIYDRLTSIGTRTASPEILLVTIDDQSLQQIGRWPWSRATHARLMTKLVQAKPKAIAYDVLFLEPSSDAEDRALAEAMSRAPSLFLPMSFVAPGRDGAPFDALEPIPAFRAAARGIGHVNLSIDPDGVVRRVQIAMGAEDRPWLHLMELVHQSLRSGSPLSRTSEDAHKPVLIPFSGGAGNWSAISAAAVLRGEVPPEILRDRLIVVGATAEALGDRYLVPPGGMMSGAEIQANLLNGLLGGSMIKTPHILALLAFCLIPLWGQLLAFRYLPQSAHLPCLAGATTLVLLISGAGVLWLRTWLPPGAALAGVWLAYPLWAWRQLSSADTFMNTELQRFAGEARLLPQTTERTNAGPIGSTIQRLGQAITEARELRHFVSDCFDKLPDATLVTGAAGRVVLANAAFVQLFDSLEAPLAHRTNAASLLAYFQDAASREPLALIDREPNGCMMPELLEKEAVTEDGRVFALRFAPQVSANGEFCMGWIIRIVDISHVRAAQRQREDILQLLTHDMRSPQASILALLETANPDQIDPVVAGRIDQYARRTLGLADGFVQLARAEALDYVLEEVDLADLLMDAIDDVWPQFTAKNILVETVAIDERLIIHGERSLLTRSLVNVIGNAVKYSDGGTLITCTLAQRPGRDGKMMAICAVADEGPGLAPEHHRLIFERFRRGPTEVGRKTDGVGLGLSFVHTVMKRHKGEIECASEPERGSTFTFVLPMVG